MKRALTTLTATSFAISLATGAIAESHVFKITALGLNAGTVTINADTKGSNYSANGTLVGSGLLRKFIDIGYNGAARGKIVNGDFRPSAYKGHTKAGKRKSKVAMTFKSGRPKVISYDPKRPKEDHDISPAKQIGTRDLLTSTYLVLKDVSAAELCNKTLPMFDGRRRTQLTLGAPKIDGNKARCAGVYSRISGFSPNAMSKGKTYPFTLKYTKLDDGTYRLMSFSTKTTFGSARAVRQ